MSIAVSMAVLEMGGAFGVLWPVLIGYCIVVCIFSIVYAACTRDKMKMKAYFLNPSIIGFLFAALFYIVLSSGKNLFYAEWDVFLHWGMFSKAAFYYHNLDIWRNDLVVNHSIYPHGIASWYSLFSLGKEIYTERDVMISINVLLFASCCPIVDIAVSKMKKMFSGKKIIFLLFYLLSGMSVASFLWIWKFEEGGMGVYLRYYGYTAWRCLYGLSLPVPDRW